MIKGKIADKEKVLDSQYNSLPEIFKQRIDAFRKANPSFRKDDLESYELYVCTEAVKIANCLKSKESIWAWRSMDLEKRKELVPEHCEEHSDNSIGLSCMLAVAFVTNHANVLNVSGALTQIVGRHPYGQ